MENKGQNFDSRSLWIGFGSGILYGAVAQLIVHTGPLKTYPRLQHYIGAVWILMTLSFLFVMPFALGAITVYSTEKRGLRSWKFAVFAPWVPALILLIAAGIVGMEGSICLLMGLPLFLIFSSIGGLLAHDIARRKMPAKSKDGIIIAILLLPYVGGPLETRIQVPDTVRKVETQIWIAAPAQTVWKNVEQVPAIQPQEQGFSFFHLIGFPKPIAATLTHPGIGGIRHATFEHGVHFTETITQWDFLRELTFKIKADPVPASTLDEHVTIGGPYFDMLEGDYRLEPKGPNSVLLHLSSTHRLSTRFNFYSGLWTDAIMRDIQNYILRIIKKRAESASENARNLH